MKEMDQDGCLVEADTHEASQNWQHTYEESGISITAGKGGILETWVIEPQAGPHEVSQGWPSIKDAVILPIHVGYICTPEHEADTPVVTEAKE